MKSKTLELVHTLNSLGDTQYMNHEYYLNEMMKLAREAYQELTVEERAVGMASSLHSMYEKDIERMNNDEEPKCINDAGNFMVSLLEDLNKVFNGEDK